MRKKKSLFLGCLFLIVLVASNVFSPGIASQSNSKPNILFISIDDMNDWGGLDGYRGEVHTPNFDRLAEKGVTFTNAHAPSPVCNPSRTAVMTGLMPSSSGVYNNAHWWAPALPDIQTIPEYFKSNGYYTAGAGKLFHHTAGFNPPDQWHEYFDQVFDDPWSHASYYPELSEEKPEWFPLNGLTGKNKPSNPNAVDWGPLDKKDLQMGDGQAVDWAMDFLSEEREKPFFLGVGIYRPHIPWYAPREYFGEYPVGEVKQPLLKEDDLADVPPIGQKFANRRSGDFQLVRHTNKYDDAIQAYLASIAYADALVGYLLEALDKSSYADNTIIVLWSDHGFHLGEKNHWHKSTLWERATRVPFIVVDPRTDTQGVEISKPVGLIDLYPTLVDLTGLGSYERLDGQSLVPLMNNPNMEWEKPALTTFGRGNHAVRSERWRYIRYRDGTEELYDHKTDPHEWNNLADQAKYDSVKQELGKWIPENEAEPVPVKAAYNFDRETYTFELKSEK